MECADRNVQVTAPYRHQLVAVGDGMKKTMKPCVVRRTGQTTPRLSWAPRQLSAPSLPAEPRFSLLPAPPLESLPACSPHWPWSSCKRCDHTASKTTVPGMLRASELRVWLLPKATDQHLAPDTTWTPSSHPTSALTTT